VCVSRWWIVIARSAGTRRSPDIPTASREAVGSSSAGSAAAAIVIIAARRPFLRNLSVPFVR